MEKIPRFHLMMEYVFRVDPLGASGHPRHLEIFKDGAGRIGGAKSSLRILLGCPLECRLGDVDPGVVD